MSKNQKKFILYEDEEEYNNIDLNNIYEMNFTIESIYCAFNLTKLEILQYLVKLKLIKNKMICNDCERLMNLVKSKTVDGFVWICNNHSGRIHSNVRKLSFFENMKKSFKVIFLFLYYWSKKDIQSEISREIKINKNTASEWAYCLREVLQLVFLFSKVKLGGINIDGTPKVVEIDESLFFKRKYNRGRFRQQQWVFGMIERGSNKAKLFIVPDRSKETLEPIIRENILEGSHIISDKWAAYRFLEQDTNYSYSSINHSEFFVDPENNSIHTQTIESCWMHCKKLLRNKFGTQEHFLEGYLYEYMFRRAIVNKEKTFNELLIVVIRINELHNNEYE